MQQPITGFHRDEVNDWVAELACGHCQHVRHDPPWMVRPWVETERGRASMLGQTLLCKKCDEGAPAYQAIVDSARVAPQTEVGTVATLHLMVGLPCSGKTTLAKQLEHERSALRLTPDEWQIRLFGQDAEEPEHDARHSLIEDLLWNIACRALALGTNVILDFGFWSREEREDYRLRAQRLGAASEVHFLDVPEDELLRRLAVRNMQASQETFYIAAETMKPWIASFQRPTPAELERRE